VIWVGAWTVAGPWLRFSARKPDVKKQELQRGALWLRLGLCGVLAAVATSGLLHQVVGRDLQSGIVQSLLTDHISPAGYRVHGHRLHPAWRLWRLPPLRECFFKSAYGVIQRTPFAGRDDLRDRFLQNRGTVPMSVPVLFRAALEIVF
jgi:hypothetical protein